ncbi:MAG: hypothetical protein HYU97_03825 [Deltaproteobacteria bacterium]|nr:hypothetical protein [Deltaproteobacteria bacterium]
MIDILKKIISSGVLPRNAFITHRARNMLKLALQRKIVRKVYRRGRVFYELTEKSIPLLEVLRRQLLEEIKLRQLLYPQSRVYRALLEDLRFLDEKNPRAQEFLFLGDWQLRQPVVPSRLKLSQERFYQKLDS